MRDSQKSLSFVITVVDVKKEERGEGVLGGSSDVGRKGRMQGEILENMVNICNEKSALIGMLYCGD